MAEFVYRFTLKVLFSGCFVCYLGSRKWWRVYEPWLWWLPNTWFRCKGISTVKFQTLGPLTKTKEMIYNKFESWVSKNLPACFVRKHILFLNRIKVHFSWSAQCYRCLSLNYQILYKHIIDYLLCLFLLLI